MRISCWGIKCFKSLAIDPVDQSGSQMIRIFILIFGYQFTQLTPIKIIKK